MQLKYDKCTTKAYVYPKYTHLKQMAQPKSLKIHYKWTRIAESLTKQAK